MTFEDPRIDTPTWFKLWFVFCAVVSVATLVFIGWAIVQLLGILSDAT